MLKKIYLNTYRLTAFGFLATLTTVIISFLILMIFFQINSSWIAPTVLSKDSDKMLTFASALTQATQNLETLKITEQDAQNRMTLAQSSVVKLKDLVSKLESNSNQIGKYSKVKHSDLNSTSQISSDLMKSQSDAQKALDAGVITNVEAAQFRSNTQNFHNSIADGNIGLNVADINANAGLVQAITQLQQAEVDVISHLSEYNSAHSLKIAAQKQLDDLKATTYYQVYTSGNNANLAFLPYENFDNVHVNDNVYSCALLVAWCSKVGTIDSIKNDEQTTEFPIYNVRFSRTMRGVFVTMKIDPDKIYIMRNKLLFVGYRPLLF